MISEEIKQKVSQLGLAEKLLLVEDLWDSIALRARLPVRSEITKVEEIVNYFNIFVPISLSGRSGKDGLKL